MSIRVVIADDDADIRTLVKISVARAGFEVIADLDNGESAAAAIHELKPDLAILDVSMPGLTGVEVCQSVRADPELNGVRLLLLSAAVDDASKAVGIAAGADDYLIKPFSPRELVAELTAIMDQQP